MTRIGATPSETSCLISNLFTEIRPVCGHCEGDSVVLCGVTYEGQEETVVLRDYGFDYGDVMVGNVLLASEGYRNGEPDLVGLNDFQLKDLRDAFGI